MKRSKAPPPPSPLTQLQAVIGFLQWFMGRVESLTLQQSDRPIPPPSIRPMYKPTLRPPPSPRLRFHHVDVYLVINVKSKSPRKINK